MLRVALIGAGDHCRRYHAPALARYAREHADAAELAAVCDLDGPKAEALAADFGFPMVHTDIEAMLAAEKPGAVVAVLPVPHVVPVALPMLRRGIPLSVEKPPGLNLAEARELVQVFQQTGTPCMVSSNRRHAPAMVAGLQWANDHGPIRYVRGAMLRSGRSGAGFIHSTAFHCMDALRHIGGDLGAVEPRSFDVAGVRWFLWRLHFANGTEGMMEIVPTCGSQGEHYSLFGDGYRVEIKLGFFNPGRVQAWLKGESRLDLTWDDPNCDGEYVRAGGWNETVEFLSAVREGRMPYPTPADTIQTVELLHAHSGLTAPEG
jgi:myo-inositol 2-dehydrogenase/D-chiro-inositol 1-dehydrogenase